eukprot:4114590-Amphidinium_carterae.1
MKTKSEDNHLKPKQETFYNTPKSMALWGVVLELDSWRGDDSRCAYFALIEGSQPLDEWT